MEAGAEEMANTMGGGVLEAYPPWCKGGRSRFESWSPSSSILFLPETRPLAMALSYLLMALYFCFTAGDGIWWCIQQQERGSTDGAA